MCCIPKSDVGAGAGTLAAAFVAPVREPNSVGRNAALRGNQRVDPPSRNPMPSSENVLQLKSDWTVCED